MLLQRNETNTGKMQLSQQMWFNETASVIYVNLTLHLTIKILFV